MLHALHYHSSGFFIIMSPAEGLHFSALVFGHCSISSTMHNIIGTVRVENFKGGNFCAIQYSVLFGKFRGVRVWQYLTCVYEAFHGF